MAEKYDKFIDKFNQWLSGLINEYSLYEESYTTHRNGLISLTGTYSVDWPPSVDNIYPKTEGELFSKIFPENVNDDLNIKPYKNIVSKVDHNEIDKYANKTINWLPNAVKDEISEEALKRSLATIHSYSLKYSLQNFNNFKTYGADKWFDKFIQGANRFSDQEKKTDPSFKITDDYYFEFILDEVEGILYEDGTDKIVDSVVFLGYSALKNNHVEFTEAFFERYNGTQSATQSNTTGTQSGTQSTTQSNPTGHSFNNLRGIGDIKVSILDPKTDAGKKIEGTITFNINGPFAIPIGRVINLPYPFTNPSNNEPVDIKDGVVEYTGEKGRNTPEDRIELVKKMANSLKEIIEYKYGLSLFFKIDEEKTQDDTKSLENTTANTTTGYIDRGEILFSCEKDSYFIGNKDIGELLIISEGEIHEEITEVDLMMQAEETLDEEYGEGEFQGEEEGLIVPMDTSDFVVSVDQSAINEIKGNDPENPDPKLSTDMGSRYPLSTDKAANAKKIVKAAKSAGVTNKYAIAAILAIVNKESGLVPKSEASYAKTGSARIKKIFSAFRKYSDSEVDSIKKDPKRFFDTIYGGKYGNASDEGYKYRGRGFNQITFKGNYKKYKDLSGYDIVGDPDLLNTIDVAARCVIEYFKSNIKSAPSDKKSRYNFTDINSFKTLDDAVGAIYHANAGWGNSYSTIVADSTGGRAKSFKYAPTMYKDYAEKS